MSATSPYRATQPSLPQTPSRRALGDLTPHALNSPTIHSTPKEPSDAIRPRSQLKKVTSHIPSVFADKENLDTSSPVVQGKKRGIEQVEDVEKAGGAKMLAHARDESLWNSGVRLTAAAMQQHTVRMQRLARPPSTDTHQENNPVGLADPGSPTERNTPTPEPEPIQQSQKSNQSFSDFLNYELCASQKSDQGPAESTRTVAPQPASAEPKKSRAEILRTRLKFGLYKVKTHQETKKGKDIISSFEASSSPSASMEVPNITISSPHRDMPVFVKANLDPFQPIGKLGRPPIQFAIPTEIYDPNPPPPQIEEHHDVEVLESAHQRLQRLKTESYRASNLVNSAVKGNAAVGLLELMSGRR
jgi:hypothetical protein